MQKIFRAALMAIFIVTFVFASVAVATVKLYTATAEDYANEAESQDVAMLRARDKAIKKAAKEAGVYLKTYSRSVNSELTDDEVIAITSNSWQLVGEPKYIRELVKHSDETTIIVWTATVEVNVDDSEIQRWIKRDNKDKSTIISQTLEAQKAAEENDRQIVNLREQYNRATTQAEKDQIRKQMNDADRDFLANQKIEEGLKCIYEKYDHDTACRLFNEAIEINPNSAMAYYRRGQVHHTWGNIPQAIDDYKKSIELNPNYSEVHRFLGDVYVRQRSYQSAIDEYDKALKLDPQNGNALSTRGYMYMEDLEDYQNAIADFTKLIELHLERINAGNLGTNWNHGFHLFNAYFYRAVCYKELNLNEAAKADEENEEMYRSFFSALSNKAGEISPEMNYQQALSRFDSRIKSQKANNSVISEWWYYWRGYFYQKLNRYTEALADFDEAIKINPNHADIYHARGLCYQSVGETKKAQADFAKAKALGHKG